MFLEPWFFASGVPVIKSEILYHLLSGVDMTIWGFGPGIDAVKTEQNSDVLGRTFRASAQNLPSLPAEPYLSPPATSRPASCSSRRRVDVRGLPVVLLQNWQSTCELYKGIYRKALHDDYDASQARRFARPGDGEGREGEELRPCSGTSATRSKPMKGRTRIRTRA